MPFHIQSQSVYIKCAKAFFVMKIKIPCSVPPPILIFFCWYSRPLIISQFCLFHCKEYLAFYLCVSFISEKYLIRKRVLVSIKSIKKIKNNNYIEPWLCWQKYIKFDGNCVQGKDDYFILFRRGAVWKFSVLLNNSYLFTAQG